MSVESWLASIGLGAYAQGFRARGMERERLHEVTEHDFDALGLSPAERARFRAAIEREMPRAGAWLRAERRPLTMMFVDLVGSSRLAEILAPEDLGELLKSYEEFCRRPIEKFGGRIVRMVGDGLLAYFCHPVANENDPERAVRAALAITRAIGNVGVPGGEPMQVRIGIATGPVVVGDLRTDSRIWPDTVVGAAPNLAARLQQVARDGGIVIAQETYDHLRGRFHCAPLGSHRLRGISGARPAWEVQGEADLSRAEIRTRASALFGRDRELARLDALWARARAGRGAIAVVSGEPGIGKSRLVEAALARGDPHARSVHLEGAEFDMDSPLRPVVTWLQRTAATPPATPPATPTGAGPGPGMGAGAILRTRLPGWAGVEATLAYLLDNGASAPPAGTPEQVREATLSGLLELVLAEARAGPLRLVVEDLHWCDPTTVEWIGRLAAGIAARPVLLLITRRATDTLPAFLQPGDGVEHIALQPLDDENVATLARSMLLEHRISPAVLRVIQRKAGGTPLFVEEVVRTLVARDEIAVEQIDEADPLIPASVHEALAGRLDRLGEIKGIAQAAAVIGPDIRHDLLARVCQAQLDMDDERIARAILELHRGGILAEGALGVPSSTFSHGVIRDAAYGSLLRERKQALHLAVARTLATRLPDVVAAQPEVVAHHFAEGSDPAASLPHWLAAARQSLARSALLEGTKVLRKGLQNIDRLPPAPELTERRLDFMALLGPALLSLSGPGAEETVAHYRQAIGQAQEAPNSPRLAPIYWGWWRVASDNLSRLARSEDMLVRTRALGDPEALMQAHHCCWASHFHAGNLARCRTHIREGLALYERHGAREHAHLYGNHDAKVCGCGELALVEWMMGRPRSALAEGQRAEDWAARLDHLGTRAHSLELRLDRQFLRRSVGGVADAAREMEAVALEHGFSDARNKAQIFQGWVRAIEGDAGGGLALLRGGVARERAIGTNEDLPMYLAMEAETLILARQFDEARQVLGDGDTELARKGWWFWRPEVWRLQAEALAASRRHAGDGRHEAAARFRDAIAMADEQGAVMLALRAAISLARLAPDAAAIGAVRARLAAIEEPDGPDIAAARSLLEGAREDAGWVGFALAS